MLYKCAYNVLKGRSSFSMLCASENVKASFGLKNAFGENCS